MSQSATNEIEKPIVIHDVQPLTEAMLNNEVMPGMTLSDFLKKECRMLIGEVGQMYAVYETKVKGPIELLEGNRIVSERHVQRLMGSYKKDGYYFTILDMNERLEEIDGQHRFESAMRKNLPVRFMIMPGWGIKEVKVLNFNTKNWSPLDFLESYATQGYPNYVRFKKFFDENPFDISTCQILLTGKKSYGDTDDDFKDGKLELDEEMIIHASKKVEKIKMLKRFHPKGWKSRSHVEAVMILINTKDYDHQYLIEKLEKYPIVSLLNARSLRTAEYVKLYEERFNFGRQKSRIQVTSRL